ncbi:MAG: hypothetical protein IVW57_12330, partial [Ktedonobacterales bacterium]|nr:hypothetical protein [Ktedonobacterales bacterium]
PTPRYVPPPPPTPTPRPTPTPTPRPTPTATPLPTPTPTPTPTPVPVPSRSGQGLCLGVWCAAFVTGPWWAYVGGLALALGLIGPAGALTLMRARGSAGAPPPE